MALPFTFETQLGSDFRVQSMSEFYPLARGWKVTHRSTGLWMWTYDLMEVRNRLLDYILAKH